MKKKKAILMLLVAALLSPVLWAKGGNDVKLKVELDRATLHANQNEKVILKVTLDAPLADKLKRRAVNICLVIDKSGSMSGTKIEDAKKAAISVLKRLHPTDLFSLVVYDGTIQTLVPAQHPKNTEAITKAINSITASGGTALFGGVSQGAAEIRKNNNKKYLNRVFLLSDGQANIGPSSPEDLQRLGIALSKENIVVTTIGLGTGYNEDLMTKLAVATDSLTYFVENSNDLPRIFNKELGDVLSIVSNSVKIKIDVIDGVKIVRTIGRQGRINGNTVEFDIKHLYSGQELFTLIELEVPPTEEKSTRNLANISLSYENLLTEKKQTNKTNITANFSKKEAIVVASANKKVQASCAQFNNALVLNQTIVLLDQGKQQEALKNIDNNIIILQQQQKKYGNKLLEKDITNLKKRKKSISSKKYNPKMRKDMN
ncbi:MAG: VWA domain-containing protein, partial [Lentisphaeria bacterium]|nr:VWA domain-containing protein [Lentisphaeria bacterium]